MNTTPDTPENDDATTEDDDRGRIRRLADAAVGGVPQRSPVGWLVLVLLALSVTIGTVNTVVGEIRDTRLQREARERGDLIRCRERADADLRADLYQVRLVDRPLPTGELERQLRRSVKILRIPDPELEARNVDCRPILAAAGVPVDRFGLPSGN